MRIQSLLRKKDQPPRRPSTLRIYQNWHSKIEPVAGTGHLTATNSRHRSGFTITSLTDWQGSAFAQFGQIHQGIEHQNPSRSSDPTTAMTGPSC